jgi:hypothetical protein
MPESALDGNHQDRVEHEIFAAGTGSDAGDRNHAVIADAVRTLPQPSNLLGYADVVVNVNGDVARVTAVKMCLDANHVRILLCLIDPA